MLVLGNENLLVLQEIIPHLHKVDAASNKHHSCRVGSGVSAVVICQIKPMYSCHTGSYEQS